MLDIALKLGDELELSDSELNRLQILINLHDIGMINLPEKTLTKEEPMTKIEWEMMKAHPETGYRIALATEKFAHVADDILSHHERWDGTGYPRGLKEDAIPLLARITTIADAYEVMTHGRPYKEPKPKAEIIEELHRCAGYQFDPHLVEVFTEILLKE